MGTQFLKGHGRRVLFSSTALSIPGSTALVAANAQPYSRFTGIVSIIGSVTVQYRLGVNSGTYQVSSTFVANSGGSVFDVLNIGGNVVDWTFTAANSQANVVINIVGEPIR